MSVVFGIIVGLLILMFLVTAHEFGHFIAARKNGVEVEEFGIGFPPRAIAWQILAKNVRLHAETRYGICFSRPQGSAPRDPPTAETRPKALPYGLCDARRCSLCRDRESRSENRRRT